MAYHTKIQAFWGFQVDFDEKLPLRDVVAKHYDKNKAMDLLKRKRPLNLSNPTEVYGYAFDVMGPEKAIALLFDIDEKRVVTSWIEHECNMDFFIAVGDIINIYNDHSPSYLLKGVVSLTSVPPSVDKSLLAKLKQYKLECQVSPKITSRYDK